MRIMEGVFAINKPAGATSRFVLDQVNRLLVQAPLFQKQMAQQTGKRGMNKLKMGHGGTLDPLAEGVLVVGIGSGTKTLGDYMNGSVKKYECVGLLGGSTTTGDSEGELIQKTANDYITRDMLNSAAEKMVGTLDQTPPIFSALKMDGMPLYEYARRGLPLPRAIKSREVNIYSIDVKDNSLSIEHNYKFLPANVDEDGQTLVSKLSQNPTLNDHPVPFAREWLEKARGEGLKVEAEPIHPFPEDADFNAEQYRAPLIHFDAKVSSGTYIRSLLSDMGRAVGSSAYMVKLVRWQQGEWDLEKNVFELDHFVKYKPEIWLPVLEKVLNDKNTNVKEEIARMVEAHPEAVKTEGELKAEKEKEEAKLAAIAEKRTQRDQNGKGKHKRRKYNNNNQKKN